MRLAGLGGTIAAVGSLVSSAAAAQPAARVSIGTITSQQSCTTYVLSAGRNALRVDAYSITAASAWRTWLQRDCVSDFRTVRSSLAAALAASRRVQVTNHAAPGSFVLSAVISATAPTTSSVSGADFAMAHDRSGVVLTWTLRDPAGRVVDGGIATQSVETGSSVQTDAMASADSSGGQTAFTRLEQALAISTARKVAFRVEPLRVVAVGPDGIQLNCGAPLLSLGTALQVQTRDGRVGRYLVVAAGDGISNAEAGGPDFALAPGDRATVLEEDDPQTNARRIGRIDLP